MTTAFLAHPVFLQHDMGSHHPERPARLEAIPVDSEGFPRAGGLDETGKHHAKLTGLAGANRVEQADDGHRQSAFLHVGQCQKLK